MADDFMNSNFSNHDKKVFNNLYWVLNTDSEETVDNQRMYPNNILRNDLNYFEVSPHGSIQDLSVASCSGNSNNGISIDDGKTFSTVKIAENFSNRTVSNHGNHKDIFSNMFWVLNNDSEEAVDEKRRSNNITLNELNYVSISPHETIQDLAGASCSENPNNDSGICVDDGKPLSNGILSTLNSLDLYGSQLHVQDIVNAICAGDSHIPDNPIEKKPLIHSLPSTSKKLSDSHFNNRQAFANSESAPVESIENGVSQSVVSTLSHIPSSLPASQNWPGEYNFDVSFSPQEKSTKGVSWTYSKALEKLYVGKDAPCPVNFSTSTTMPDDVKVRAMALYSSPESASEVVKRCVNHSLEEKSNNIFEAEHLVRCESSTTTYEIDSTTKRHSVIVPFENPPVGQPFSTYIYKFTCFGSCPFGPNRRPLMLVFTLERGMEVIGRRKIDLKICACPGRDRKSDEQQTMSLENGTSKKRKEAEFVSLSDVLDFTKGVTYPATKKTKTTPLADGLHRDGLYPDGLYHITVKDEKCFNFLIQMKKLYEICAMVKSIPPDTKKAIFQMHSLKQLAPET